MHARLVAPRRRLVPGSARQQNIKNESIIADELLAYIGTGILYLHPHTF